MNDECRTLTPDPCLMGIETIKRHQLRGDAELARKIRAEIAAGRNTRNPIEIDNLWAKCRRCIYYRGVTCAEIDLHPEEPDLHQLLTRSDLRCKLWSAGSQIQREMPATSTSEEMVDRMHRQGTTRSREERKAARNAHRRGRRGSDGVTG